MSNIIQKLTVDCPREDCRVAYESSSSTLIGWLQEYDKRGNPIGRDPNKVTSYYACIACGARWTIERQNDCDVIKKSMPRDAGAS